MEHSCFDMNIKTIIKKRHRKSHFHNDTFLMNNSPQRTHETLGKACAIAVPQSCP